MNYISKFSPRVGDSIEEAGNAEKVIVVSDSQDETLKQILESDGAKVCFASPPFSENLGKAVSSEEADIFCKGG